MKLPLWAWDEVDKKWVNFPYELLQTFPDGQRGFEAECLCDKCLKLYAERQPQADILERHKSKFRFLKCYPSATLASSHWGLAVNKLQGKSIYGRWIYKEEATK